MDFTEQSPCWLSASQEITRILWNPIMQYRSHQILPLLPILNQMNPVHSPLSSNFWILILTFWRLTTHIWVVPHR